MKSFKRLLFLLAAAALSLGAVFAIAACKGKEPSVNPPEKVEYKVTVTCSTDSEALDSLRVKLSKDGAEIASAAPKVPDNSNGVWVREATFSLTPDSYTVELTGLDENFTYTKGSLTAEKRTETITVTQKSTPAGPDRTAYLGTWVSRDGSSDHKLVVTAAEIEYYEGGERKEIKDVVFGEDGLTFTLEEVLLGTTSVTHYKVLAKGDTLTLHNADTFDAERPLDVLVKDNGTQTPDSDLPEGIEGTWQNAESGTIVIQGKNIKWTGISSMEAPLNGTLSMQDGSLWADFSDYGRLELLFDESADTLTFSDEENDIEIVFTRMPELPAELDGTWTYLGIIYTITGTNIVKYTNIEGELSGVILSCTPNEEGSCFTLSVVFVNGVTASATFNREQDTLSIEGFVCYRAEKELPHQEFLGAWADDTYFVYVDRTTVYFQENSVEKATSVSESDFTAEEVVFTAGDKQYAISFKTGEDTAELRDASQNTLLATLSRTGTIENPIPFKESEIAGDHSIYIPQTTSTHTGYIHYSITAKENKNYKFSTDPDNLWVQIWDSEKSLNQSVGQWERNRDAYGVALKANVTYIFRLAYFGNAGGGKICSITATEIPVEFPDSYVHTWKDAEENPAYTVEIPSATQIDQMRFNGSPVSDLSYTDRMGGFHFTQGGKEYNISINDEKNKLQLSWGEGEDEFTFLFVNGVPVVVPEGDKENPIKLTGETFAAEFTVGVMTGEKYYTITVETDTVYTVTCLSAELGLEIRNSETGKFILIWDTPEVNTQQVIKLTAGTYSMVVSGTGDATVSVKFKAEVGGDYVDPQDVEIPKEILDHTWKNEKGHKITLTAHTVEVVVVNGSLTIPTSGTVISVETSEGKTVLTFETDRLKEYQLIYDPEEQTLTAVMSETNLIVFTVDDSGAGEWSGTLDSSWEGTWTASGTEAKGSWSVEITITGNRIAIKVQDDRAPAFSYDEEVTITDYASTGSATYGNRIITFKGSQGEGTLDGMTYDDGATIEFIKLTIGSKVYSGVRKK